MGLTPSFTSEDVASRFDAFIIAIQKRQIKRLQYLAEQCVIHARSIPADIGFRDQTGNLRSSIGYMIFLDGVAIHENYAGTSEGADAGRALARKASKRHPSGLLLVVTAGMSYALKVEAKGRDVLSSAEAFAEQELPSMLEQLDRNIQLVLNENE